MAGGGGHGDDAPNFILFKLTLDFYISWFYPVDQVDLFQSIQNGKYSIKLKTRGWGITEVSQEFHLMFSRQVLTCF